MFYRCKRNHCSPYTYHKIRRYIIRSPKRHIMEILIVGGGIFGCSIAIELAKSGFDTTLIEASDEILSKASRNNHNRIHYGYHYPRSTETALQSLDGLVSFLMDYRGAIVTGFPNYYAIAKDHSLVSSKRFESFCDAVGIGYHTEFPSDDVMNKELIDSSLRVEEPIYDWDLLHSIIHELLTSSGVKLYLNTKFSQEHLGYDHIINCTYSSINEVNSIAGVPRLRFKLQDVIIPTFKLEHPRVGLTVMDGPFCSIMPRGKNENEFLLYHAKYSIINETLEDTIIPKEDVEEHVSTIIKDSKRYFPFLEDAEFVENWRSVRAIPITTNSERLSRIITYPDHPNFTTVFSGKVSTCIKIAKQIKHGLLTGDFYNNMSV